MKRRLAVGTFSRIHIAVALLLVISGCAAPRDQADTLVHDAGWHWNALSAGAFDLMAASPSGRRGPDLWVYMEGDGFAYISPAQPSSDPTPHNPMGLRLALAHPGAGAVAYLARPCQYVDPAHNHGCQQDYWTGARFAPKVVASTNMALDILKAESGASRLILVGYSGGGALAVLVAVRRADIAGIITVAADLDLAYWTRRNKLTPMAGSLDPASEAGAVAFIPQVHFTGEHDDVVGTDVARAFVDRLPPGAPARIVEVPGFTHACCWAEEWKQLIARPEVKAVAGGGSHG